MRVNRPNGPVTIPSLRKLALGRFVRIASNHGTRGQAACAGALRTFLGRSLVMRGFVSAVKAFMVNEDGPTAVEYAVMLALIIVVCIVIIGSLGNSASKTFGDV